MATNNAINLKLSGVPTYDGAGTFTASTLTQNALLYGGASNLISSLALTNGQLAIGNTGNPPTAATLTAGTGISIANASGSITINASGSGLSWTTVSGTSQAMAVNNGYTANNAGLVTLTLPATAAIGDTVAVCGLGAGGWLIAQNAGQLIHLGSSVTTTGAGGSLASTNAFDTITLTCIVANTTWTTRSVQGNLTVV
jgi:hypothetical protein